jgi:hypothetical protein
LHSRAAYARWLSFATPIRVQSAQRCLQRKKSMAGHDRLSLCTPQAQVSGRERGGLTRATRSLDHGTQRNKDACASSGDERSRNACTAARAADESHNQTPTTSAGNATRAKSLASPKAFGERCGSERSEPTLHRGPASLSTPRTIPNSLVRHDGRGPTKKLRGARLYRASPAAPGWAASRKATQCRRRR